MDFAEMMTLHVPDPSNPDLFEVRGPRYPWGGLYGGQIVAQGLRAAAATVDPDHHVHSLHAYFIRRGDHSVPVRFEVDRLRNGRSFTTRAAVASQASGAILEMAASFVTSQTTDQVQTAAAPPVPGPDELDEDGWSGMFDRRMVSIEDGRAIAWLRLRGPVTTDPVLSACALAYLSDELATDAVRSLQQQADGQTVRRWNGISLDHALWFQAPLTAGEWQLYDFRCDGLVHPRGLAVGHVFDAAGAHLATVTQEVLLRPVGQPPAGG